MRIARRRVLLVGWDAADWKVIHPLMDAGKMPTVARLVERGAMANLATLQPVLSPMLWTSIATGKRPFKHGIHGFSEPSPDGGGIRPVTNLSRKTKAIWNILSQNGLTSNVVGWWPSHPAEPIRGAMVSNHFQQAVGPPEEPWPVPAGAVHPPELAETLAALRLNPNELLAEHILPFVPRAAEIDQQQDRRLASCGQDSRRVHERQRGGHVADGSIGRGTSWPSTSTRSTTSATRFMRYHPPRQEHVDERDFELYRGVIEAGYRYHDMMLHTLVRNGRAGDDRDSDVGPRLPPRPPAAASGFRPSRPGPAFEHRDFGIFVMAGPGIVRGQAAPRRQSARHHADAAHAVRPAGRARTWTAGRFSKPFAIRPTIATIPSWDEVPGDAGLHPPDVQLDPVESQAAIEQLVALGYIEPPPANRQQAIDNTVRELRYNLARSYMDDGQHGAAAEILEELYERWPNEHRFGVQLASCYQALERIADLRSVVEDLATRRRDDADAARAGTARVGASSFALGRPRPNQDKSEPLTDARAAANSRSAQPCPLQSRGRSSTCGAASRWPKANYERALAHFEQRRARSTPIGRACCCRLARPTCDCAKLDRAEQSFQRAAAIDPENPHVYLGFCRVHLLRHENAAAAESALCRRSVCATNSRWPISCSAGRCSGWAARCRPIDALHVALSINPHFAEAHRLLAIIHRRRLGDFEQAAYASPAGPGDAHRPPRSARRQAAVHVEASRVAAGRTSASPQRRPVRARPNLDPSHPQSMSARRLGSPRSRSSAACRAAARRWSCRCSQPAACRFSPTAAARPTRTIPAATSNTNSSRISATTTPGSAQPAARR